MDGYSMLNINNLGVFVIPAGILLLSLLCGLLIRKILFAGAARWSKNTKTHIDDVIVGSLGGPFIIWSLMLGIYLALRYLRVTDDVSRITGKLLLVLGIFSVTLALANISVKLIKVYSSKVETALPVTSLTQNISKIIIFIIGILVIFNSLGISIAPVMATLGIGGLAVALALQDTLSNIFSGFYIIATKQIKVGEYVKLDSGEEGYVRDITWRTTKIRMLANNIVLVPNEKLTKAIVTNYHLPEKELSVLVDLGVHYGSDLEKVEKVTCETAKETLSQVPGGVAEFEPFIRYGSFGDSSINFSVILRVKEFVDQYLIKHEFIKRLHKRYAREGIVIPYPIRAINYEQEKQE
ncbi:MAG: mechanosensitive ion channel family protein [Candidatus Omnitrophica bacterium]|nr:mechanosensitive ion channel family protein [Candidatus Omnitrophota bacterium]MDD5501565.1 mechanosensitive ion channel family protein [Candidatus Omnitrophota bacterium]